MSGIVSGTQGCGGRLGLDRNGLSSGSMFDPLCGGPEIWDSVADLLELSVDSWLLERTSQPEIVRSGATVDLLDTNTAVPHGGHLPRLGRPHDVKLDEQEGQGPDTRSPHAGSVISCPYAGGP